MKTKERAWRTRQSGADRQTDEQLEEGATRLAAGTALLL